MFTTSSQQRVMGGVLNGAGARLWTEPVLSLSFCSYSLHSLTNQECLTSLDMLVGLNRLTPAAYTVLAAVPPGSFSTPC